MIFREPAGSEHIVEERAHDLFYAYRGSYNMGPECCNGEILNRIHRSYVGWRD